MKTYFLFLCTLLIPFVGLKSQTIPELQLNGLTLNNSNATYSHPGKIISPHASNSPVSVSGSSQVNFKAGHEVQLKDGFKASSITGSGYFRAFISNPDFEVVFIEPNNAYPQVPKYEKLELGIKLPANIEQLITNYFNNVDSPPNTINPYDFNQISVEATFNGINNHYLPYSRKVYGFFYRDYTRNNTTQLWDEVQTDYHWRVRFSPEYTGNWNGSIVINFPSNSSLPSLSVNGIQFQCVNNPDPGEIGHIRKHSSSEQYLCSQQYPDKSFIPIGQNLDFTTYNGGYHPDVFNSRAQNITDYIANQNNIIDLFAKGGNFFRTQLEPWSYEIEWEKLGDYDSRQYSAWELDNVMNMLYQNNSYIQLCLYNQWQFHLGSPANHMYYNWEYIYNQLPPYNNYNIHSPYKDIPGAVNPVDVFCTPCSADEYFKRKARYIIARWGYNTHILAYEISNESDQMFRLSDDSYPYQDDDLSAILKINNWHFMMASYIKSLDEGKHLVTTGYAAEINENTYSQLNIDVTQIHSYSDNPYVNCVGPDDRSNFRKNMTEDYNKPTLFAEIGFNGPAEGIHCTDVMFHNDMWAGLFLGGYGTGMNWWGMEKDNLRNNFTGISNFISNVNFIADDYIPENQHITSNNLGCSHFDGKMHYYALKSRNGDYAIGWVHNKEYHVKNLYNVTPMPHPTPPICTPLSWNNFWNANGYFEAIVIDNLDWNQDYKIHWYHPRTGGYLTTTFATSGGCSGFHPGRLKIPAPGLDYNTPDLAFKVEKDNASHWRNGNVEVFSNEKPLDKKLADGTKLYPVPVTDVITIEMPESSGNTRIEITDLLGKVILSKNYNSFSKESIDLSMLHPGLYIVKIIENGSIKSNTKITKL
jgi:hypothetical protein